MGSVLLLDFANWSTILACSVLKIPQGAAVLAAKSARGISLESLVLELSGFLVCLRYMSYYNYSLPTYIEYPIIIVQEPEYSSQCSKQVCSAPVSLAD